VKTAVAPLVGAIVLTAGCGSGGGEGAASTAVGLEGSWQVTLTKSELLGNPAYGHPVTAAEVRPDIGTYRLLLRHGRFRASWSSPTGISRDAGTYRLLGDLVTFHITRAWDQSHDLGEVWSYRLNVYRGELTFGRPPDRASEGPPNQMFAPWHRVAR
jgi:hypothetical protein